MKRQVKKSDTTAPLPAIAPSAWVQRHLDRTVTGGRVLDVAAGGGRHVRLARDLGFPVTAVDRDTALLAPFRDDPGVEIVTADLEGGPWPLPGRTFAAIVGTNYLWRPLFPALLAALQPDGILIWETFAIGNEAYGRPRNPDFLLAENELLALCLPDLTVLAYEHLTEQGDRPVVRQRIVARKATGPRPAPAA